MPVGYQGTITYQVFDSYLEGCAWNAYTQFGEDGLIKAVFDRIGIQNRWCFEVGASDGLFYSNTLRLRERGWSSVLMECNRAEYDKLAETYSSEDVHCVFGRVVSLDEVLSEYPAPVDLDLGVIDVDGQDYWLWNDMTRFRPRVMLVEFHWKNGSDYIPVRGSQERDQAGQSALIELGHEKGYLAVAKTHVNLLFVQENIWRQSSST